MKRNYSPDDMLWLRLRELALSCLVLLWRYGKVNTKNQLSTLDKLFIPRAIPVNLKGSESKVSLKKFYSRKKTQDRFEKIIIFAYYLTIMNKQVDRKIW